VFGGADAAETRRLLSLLGGLVDRLE
jgi:hypothetical protein